MNAATVETIGRAVTRAWHDYCHASRNALRGDEYERSLASHAMGYYHAMRDAYLLAGGKMADLEDATTWRDVVVVVGVDAAGQVVADRVRGMRARVPGPNSTLAVLLNLYRGDAMNAATEHEEGDAMDAAEVASDGACCREDDEDNEKGN